MIGAATEAVRDIDRRENDVERGCFFRTQIWRSRSVFLRPGSTEVVGDAG
jgi:hypothetical protein